MLRKRIAFVLIFIFILSAFIGCSSSKESSMDSSEPDRGYDVGDSTAKSDNDGKYYGGDSEYEDEGENSTDEFERKLIKNGTIAIEVKDVSKTYEEVLLLAAELGGYEFSSSYSDSGDYKRINLTLKIPPESINDLKEGLKSLVGEGRIKSSNISSSDITDQYYDSKARLDSLIESRDRLNELLKEGENVEDILKIENEIAIRNADIESLQGRINMWDKLVSMATITLYIDQIDDPIRHTKTVSFKFDTVTDIWNTIKNGFTSVVNVLYSIIVWIVIGVLAASPILVIGFVVIVIIRRRKKAANPQVLDNTDNIK